ncbi:MAG TPA: terpene cyclase/mutase family protein [Syntrophales bacterium]|nr:terpene cyclase/mutase family protein [Syntrophales bacterium]
MADSKTDRILDEIWKRRLPEGGFASRPGGEYRPDATAWAILALRVGGIDSQRLLAEMRRLGGSQLKDGRIALSPEHPEVYWPTPLAIFAWHRTPEFSRGASRAVSFLLKTSGSHFKRDPNSPGGHDTSLRGWGWTEDTHSWIEPTALSILALRSAGHNDHERVSEGARLLLDRQLSRGGWNYGNTTVFGTELASMPESTGLALSALSGLTAGQAVSGSIAKIKESVRSLKTPLSLGWAILGLSAWGERPSDTHDLIDRCFRRQDRYGAYDTSLVGLLAVARKAEEGLIYALS